MTNAQTIIDQLLSGYVQQYAISEEAQSVIERVRERIVSSPDAMKDAERLYGAKECDDMALGLMWVIERANAESTRTTPTPEEEQAVHTGLTSTLTRMGILEETSAEPGDMPVDEPEAAVPEGMEGAFDETSEPAQEDSAVMAEESLPQMGGEAAFEAEAATDEPAADMVMSPEPADSATAGEGTKDPTIIGTQLEQLVEALQAGADERETLLASLRASFAACLSDTSTDPALLRYSEVVDDFLGYVQDNDLLDDVRVMNFFTNVQEPFAQWLEAPEGERDGILEQAIDFLADFRAMFE